MKPVVPSYSTKLERAYDRFDHWWSNRQNSKGVIQHYFLPMLIPLGGGAYLCTYFTYALGLVFEPYLREVDNIRGLGIAVGFKVYIALMITLFIRKMLRDQQRINSHDEI